LKNIESPNIFTKDLFQLSVSCFQSSRVKSAVITAWLLIMPADNKLNIKYLDLNIIGIHILGI
jgi:hypothetical protein